MRTNSQRPRGWKSVSAGKGQKIIFTSTGPSSVEPSDAGDRRPRLGVGSRHKGAQSGDGNVTHKSGGGRHLQSEEATKRGPQAPHSVATGK